MSQTPNVRPSQSPFPDPRHALGFAIFSAPGVYTWKQQRGFAGDPVPDIVGRYGFNCEIPVNIGVGVTIHVNIYGPPAGFNFLIYNLTDVAGSQFGIEFFDITTGLRRDPSAFDVTILDIV